MSPRVQQDGLEQILQVAATKIAPPEHSYIHDESDRLARVVVTVIRLQKTVMPAQEQVLPHVVSALERVSLV
jgi:hypothetical protein